MSIIPIIGLPGVRAARTANHRTIFLQSGPLINLAGGRYINGTKSRDPGNTGAVDRLRAGLVMGIVTSGGYYANSIIGRSTGALTGAATTLASSAAIATELSRRIGATGTFKLTGPPTAAGVVRTLTATYSALNLSTGDITITALGVSAQEDVRLSPASTGGNIQLTVQKADGTFVTTANAAWSATDATYLANINSALDTATGAAGSIVASAISATDPDLGFTLTYATATYAGVTITPAKVAVLPTSSTDWYVVPRTTGVDGRFVTASFIQPTDGSETPKVLLPDEYPIAVTDADGTSQDVPFPLFPVEAVVESSKIIDWPADASLRTWLAQQLSTAMGGKYIFDHVF